MRAGILIVILTLISCVSCTSHANTAPFVPRHDDALAVASESARLRLLIPLGNCVLGITYVSGIFHDPLNGRANGASNWVGMQGCARLDLSPLSGPAVTDAVPTDDGSIIGVGESLFRRDPDGSVHQLAALPHNFLDTPAPLALARSGQRLIVVGRKPVYDDRWKDLWKWIPTAWVSTDAGMTVREIPLPLPPVRYPLRLPDALGLGPPERPMRIAADGETVLVEEEFGGYEGTMGRRTWRSVDGGRTWSVLSLPVEPTPGLQLIAMFRAAGRWLMVLQNSAVTGAPVHLMLSSVDGSEWTVQRGLDLGSGCVVAATRDGDDNLVLIGYDTGPQSGCTIMSPSFYRYGRPPTVCEVVWTGSIGQIVRRNLRCGEYGPTPTAVTTLTDGRVLVADNAGDLWIRK